jgi:imidazolonepropionase-like amidohydrolase
MLRVVLAVCFAVFAGLAQSQPILINNVRIFNGVDASLDRGNVLIVDGLIAEISSRSISSPDGAVVLDGGDRILTPGFIDLHAHVTLQYPIEQARYHPTVAGAHSAEVARFYLDSGFTTVRDAGATHPDFARAIDAGTVYGPRIFPSGPIVSQTSGHGDQRRPFEPHPTLSGQSPYLNHGEYIIADGVDQTLMAVRENLKAGSTQIKIMGGGGVMSTFDPIHTLQSSPEEIRAAVQAAGDWGTYVMAHAYTSEAIRRLVENGVRCIEHGLLIDDATAKLVADNDVVISTQLVTYRTLQELEGISPTNLEKLELVLAGQENLVRLIKKYDIVTGFGTDFVFGGYVLIGQEFTARAEYWTPAEVLRQATSESARVIRMAGKLNRHGNFGEIREGWIADVLLLNGNPFDDISILEDPRESLAVIIKDGEIVRNKLL